MIEWYSGNTFPTPQAKYNEGDLYQDNSTMNLYQYSKGSWVQVAFSQGGLHCIVNHISGNKFEIKDISYDDQEPYLWLLDSKHEYIVSHSNITLNNYKDVVVEFVEDEAAIEFKLLFCGG